MVRARREAELLGEELLAKLTQAAYDVALRHGVAGPFIDVELALWRELSDVLTDQLTGAEALPRLRRGAAEARG